MELSLMIATRNRAAHLQHCLAWVAKISSSAAWQLIVIDNGSTDHTSNVLSSFEQVAPVPLVVCFEPRSGLGNAQNTGLQWARGKVIAFVDDDCYPNTGYVNQVLEVFQDPEIGFMGGMVRLYDQSDYPITINESNEVRLFAKNSYIPFGLIQGANMAFRRDVLKRIGGFDPEFGPGAKFNCADVDACTRASFSGWKGGYFPKPFVWHHHRRRFRDVPPVLRSYALGRGAFAAKFILNRRTAPGYASRWILHLGKELVGSGNRPIDSLYEIYGAIAYIRRHLSG
jgi:GT2 family glycosyltransferase